jgi:Spore coat polysaccharide biosynthesis protein F, CMP-KDO synthetase homolog
MKPRTVAFIQARMSSSRLPGKVLKEAGGRAILDRMVERVRKAKMLDQVVVATTVDPSDDEIARFCQAQGIEFTRGSLNDVLDRYYQAARQYCTEIVVRLTGDCPLADPGLIDDVVNALIENAADFACNRLPPPFSRTYPIGLDVEAVTLAAFERAWREAKEKHEREHVMPYLYEVPGRFRVVQLDYREDLGGLRWTLDTPQDLEFLRSVYAGLGNRNDFSWLEVLQLVREHPELSEINAAVKHKSMFDIDSRTGGEA